MNSHETPADQRATDAPRAEPLNIFFRLLIPSTGLFVFFTLVWMVSLLGDSPSPVARWFAQYGMWPIGVFFVISMVAGILALGVDNQRNRQAWSQLEARLKQAEGNATENADSSCELPPGPPVD
jgi:hypothetical protein